MKSFKITHYFLVPLLSLFIIIFTTSIAQANETHVKIYSINLSLDSPPTHMRNEMFTKYADLVSKRTQGEIKIIIHHSATEYKGENVSKALAQGVLDMGAPFFHHISKYIPESGVVLLPMFYNVTPEQVHLFSDGPVGQQLYDRIEQKLHVKVLGSPLDLGFGSLFTVNKEIERSTDIAGLKIRVPGGAATAERYRVLNAHPTIIGLADLAQSLQRGTIDGLWSTQETVASSKLWDANVKYAFNDKQAYMQYLPMINIKLWETLPIADQKIMVDTWNKMIKDMRIYALKRQAQAQHLNEQHGIIVVEPSQDDLDATKEKLMLKQDDIAKILKMDLNYVHEVQKLIKQEH